MPDFIMYPRRSGKTQNIDADKIIKTKKLFKPWNRNVEKAVCVFNTFMTMDLSFGKTQGFLNNPFITEKDIANVLTFNNSRQRFTGKVFKICN